MERTRATWPPCVPTMPWGSSAASTTLRSRSFQRAWMDTLALDSADASTAWTDSLVMTLWILHAARANHDYSKRLGGAFMGLSWRERTCVFWPRHRESLRAQIRHWRHHRVWHWFQRHVCLLYKKRHLPGTRFQEGQGHWALSVCWLQDARRENRGQFRR